MTLERRLFLCFSVLFLAAISLPYLWVYAKTPPDEVFTGVLHLPMDQMGYLEMIKQARDGRLLFEEKFSTESQTPNLFIPLWLALGWAGRLFHLPNVLVYHAARLGLSVLFLFLLRRFLSRFLTDVRARTLALPLVLFSSGFGWWAVRFPLPDPSWLPVDLVMPEAITFSSLYLNAHWAAALCLMLACFLSLTGSQEGSSAVRRGLVAGAACGILAFVHPYDVPVVWVVVAAYAALRRLRGRPVRAGFLTAFFSLSLTGAGVFYAMARRNPVAAAVADGLAMPSGHVVGYLLGWGTVLLLALAGVWFAVRDRAESVELPLAWTTSAAIMAYAPVFFQRRLVFGVHIVLCVLAAYGAVRALDHWRMWGPAGPGKGARAVLALIFLSSVPSNLSVLARDLRTEGFPRRISRGLRDALGWMDRNLGPEDAVLSSAETGMFVPAYTRSKVFVGHWCCTVDYEGKEALVRRFWDAGAPDAFRRQLMEEHGVTHVLRTAREGNPGGFDPASADYLERVYAGPDAEVYKYRGPSDPEG